MRGVPVLGENRVVLEVFNSTGTYRLDVGLTVIFRDPLSKKPYEGTTATTTTQDLTTLASCLVVKVVLFCVFPVG